MKKKKQAKKANTKHRSESHKDELTYFLDHPDIKREECVGNGSSPGTNAAGSLASKINFGGKGTAAPSSAAPTTPAASTSSSGPSIASKIGWPGAKK